MFLSFFFKTQDSDDEALKLNGPVVKNGKMETHARPHTHIDTHIQQQQQQLHLLIKWSIRVK